MQLLPLQRETFEGDSSSPSSDNEQTAPLISPVQISQDPNDLLLLSEVSTGLLPDGRRVLSLSSNPELERSFKKLLYNPMTIGQTGQCMVRRRRRKDNQKDPHETFEMHLEYRAIMANQETGMLESEGRPFLLQMFSARQVSRGPMSKLGLQMGYTRTFLVSSSPDDGDEPEKIVAEIVSNVSGTLYTAYESHPEPSDGTQCELVCISYERNILGLNGPRKIRALLPTIGFKDGQRQRIPREPGIHVMHERAKQKATDLKGEWESVRLATDAGLVLLESKEPYWNDQTSSYVLNFGGRVRFASVKNFQLVSDRDLDYVVLQFGRVGPDCFALDFRYPLSALQAFCICLSSFDPKLLCE